MVRSKVTKNLSDRQQSNKKQYQKSRKKNFFDFLTMNQSVHIEFPLNANEQKKFNVIKRKQQNLKNNAQRIEHEDFNNDLEIYNDENIFEYVSQNDQNKYKDLYSVEQLRYDKERMDRAHESWNIRQKNTETVYYYNSKSVLESLVPIWEKGCGIPTCKNDLYIFCNECECIVYFITISIFLQISLVIRTFTY